MRSTHLPLLVSGLVLLAVLASPHLGKANVRGTPAGYSGAPAVKGRTCTVCHPGTVNSGPGAVVVHAPRTFVPGSVIPVTVSLTKLQSAKRNGYQAAAYDATNHLLPGWVSPDANSAVKSHHLNQTATGSARSQWLSYFKTPLKAAIFTIHAAGLDANADHHATSDRTYTASWKLSSGTVPLSLMTLPRIGTAIRLALQSSGDKGKTYLLGASLGKTGIAVGRRVIPLTADPLLVLVINQSLPHLLHGYRGTLDSSGMATATLAIPGDWPLAGITIHHAFVVIDPTQPSGIGTISNGLAVRLY